MFTLNYRSLANFLSIAACLALFSTSLSAGHHGKKMVEVSVSGMVETSDIIDTAVSAGQFKTLAAALQAADLIKALKGKGPFTVFAPTDEAFAKLPSGVVASLLKPENKSKLVEILTYHVVSGKVPAKSAISMIKSSQQGAAGAPSLQGQFLNLSLKSGQVKIDNATVIKADIECSNGVIHVIDNVILPEDRDIVDIAAGNKTFSTLVAAVKAAGLVDALKADGPLTVFAPTDAAFQKLPEGTVESLLKPENKAKLVQVLTYHVVKGRIHSPAAIKAGSAATLQGQKIKFTVDGKQAKVNNANIVATDIDAANGVIHVIDSVILPK